MDWTEYSDTDFVVAYVDNEKRTVTAASGDVAEGKGKVRAYGRYKTKGTAKRYMSVSRDDLGFKVKKRDIEEGRIKVLSISEYDELAGEKTPSYNLLNPNSKIVWVTRSALYGCCDPGTETYHSM